ncbi:hypothetical protein D9758_000993 [Tetrapyrgos nigripes]|uniref:Jacalin-type lectin domain-containing protein n=1 Tax=Tetrapyrgos nigripes TaxID=182062 RepID=A0A8H5GZ66_9AGAR|nr:hypothetical protein D9758_000993 [Tetrapyrgos nigripes]
MAIAPSLAVLSFLFLSSITGAAAATTSGSFSILSYNVAGLPSVLSSSDPVTNTPQISPRLKPYNVIHVQEDFNSHAALYASDTHQFRTPTSGGVPLGSGLNTLSDFPFLDFERVTWDDCNLNNGDCLTPKGFTFMRMNVSDGVWVDFVNLHTDAGSDDGDRTARQSNLAQVRDYINTWSVGMPVVVMGDTNSRYTSPVDSDSLHDLLSTQSLTDSWVRNTRGGSFPTEGTDALTCPFPFPAGTSQATQVACETVDKQLVRGSTAVQLVPTSFSNENDAFLDTQGQPLSDHYPVKSVLSWTLSSSVRLDVPTGGPHGDPYNDLPTVFRSGSVLAITSITLRAADRVDGVSFTLSDGTVVTHGGSGGDAQTMSMNGNEYIVQITACQGQKDGDTRVFFFSFLTNQGRTLTGGVNTGDCQVTKTPTDAAAGGKAWGLVGFWGRNGDEMDRAGAIWGAAY